MALSPEQIAARRRGIGSSDVAALVGLHAYRTRQDVFNEKVFGVSKKRTPEMDFGNDLEEAIVRARTRELGGVRYSDDDYAKMFGERHLTGRTLRDPAHPIALDTPDEVLWLPKQQKRLVLEAKAVGWYQAKEWGDTDDDAPAGYQIQCQWHQGVSDVHDCELAAMIAGAPPVGWIVAFNDDLYRQLVEVAEQFWVDHVLKRIKPDPIDGSEGASEYLRQMYPENTAPLRKATPEEDAAAALYLAARDQETAGKDAKAFAGNQLRELLGNCDGCQLTSGGTATWKLQADGSRVLRVTEPKKPKAKRQ